MLLLWEGRQSISFWSFDIGNIILAAGLFFQTLLFLSNASRQHGENKEKIAEITKWKGDHDLDAKQRDEAIVQLREIAAAMKVTAESMAIQMEQMRRDIRELRSQRRRDS